MHGETEREDQDEENLFLEMKPLSGKFDTVEKFKMILKSLKGQQVFQIFSQENQIKFYSPF